MTEHIPSDKQRAARIALAVLAGALGTALVAGGAWMALRPKPAETPRQSEITPAEETASDTPTGTGSSESTETTKVAPGTGGGTSKPRLDGGAAGRPTRGRAARVAYRLNQKLWVADENGKNAVAVTYGYGVYSLSPDGKTLAVVPEVHEPLAPRSEAPAVKLLDVKLKALDAVSDQVSWAGTSAWVAFTARQDSSSEVRRLATSGGKAVPVVSGGSSPKASRGGARVCYVDAATSGQIPGLKVASTSGGDTDAVGGSQGALSWAWGPSEQLFFVRSVSPGSWEIRRSAPPYRTSQRLGTLDLSAPAFALHDVHVSPDGRRVLMSSFGDDEYSRLWVFDVPDARFHTISTRRDAYPYGWSADGSRILYFEGNSYQGEPSSLMSCRADGSGRRVVVEGAAR